jgi:hypothetical protein
LSLSSATRPAEKLAVALVATAVIAKAQEGDLPRSVSLGPTIPFGYATSPVTASRQLDGALLTVR